MGRALAQASAEASVGFHQVGYSLLSRDWHWTEIRVVPTAVQRSLSFKHGRKSYIYCRCRVGVPRCVL